MKRTIEEKREGVVLLSAAPRLPVIFLSTPFARHIAGISVGFLCVAFFGFLPRESPSVREQENVGFSPFPCTEKKRKRKKVETFNARRTVTGYSHYSTLVRSIPSLS